MSEFFAFLFLASLLALIVAFIKPSLLKMKSRKSAAYILGGAVVFSLVLVAITLPPPQPQSPQATASFSDNQTQAQPTSTRGTPPKSNLAAAPATTAKLPPIPPSTNQTATAFLYPNPTLTTGDVLTTDASVVCVSGYSATVRDVPLSEKEQVYAEYGVSYPQPTGMYEVDHLIPLELGGSNNIKNLWLEPASPAPFGFHQKDEYENYAHSQVCNGEITLAEAQHRMATDWFKYWKEETGNSATATIQISTATTTQITNGAALDTNSPEVKKSSAGICHEKGSTYYDRTKDYTPYDSIEACLASGGRLPDK